MNKNQFKVGRINPDIAIELPDGQNQIHLFHFILFYIFSSCFVVSLAKSIPVSSLLMVNKNNIDYYVFIWFCGHLVPFELELIELIEVKSWLSSVLCA